MNPKPDLPSAPRWFVRDLGWLLRTLTKDTSELRTPGEIRSALHVYLQEHELDPETLLDNERMIWAAAVWMENQYEKIRQLSRDRQDGVCEFDSYFQNAVW